MIHEKQITGIKAHGDLYALYLSWGGTNLQTTVKGMHGDEEKYHKWIRAGYEPYRLPKNIVKVGTNGHDWVNGITVAVIFDIDHAADHKGGGYTTEEIQDCIDKTPAYVGLYWSRQGKGIEGVVMLNLPAPTVLDHNQLAQRVKVKLKADGFPVDRIDQIGMNSWVYWSGAEGRAHTLIRAATEEIGELPELERTSVMIINDIETTPFDDEHERIVRTWAESGYTCHIGSDGENQPIVHLHARAAINDEFPLYQTISPGTDPGKHNRWARPLPNGRMLLGTYGNEEHENWINGSDGKAYFVYGKPTLEELARIKLASYGNDYCGTVAEIASAMSGLDIKIDTTGIEDADAILKRDGSKWVVTVGDARKLTKPDGWVKHKYALKWSIHGHDDETRTLPQIYAVIGNTEKGDGRDVEDYAIIVDETPKFMTLHKVKEWLERRRFSRGEIEQTIRNAREVTRRVRHLPSQLIEGQYLNSGGAKFRVKPIKGNGNDPHPTWDMLEHHMGRGLDAAVLANDWCKSNGIDKGWKFLRLVRAIMLQRPYTPLPFMSFFEPYGNAGKSFYFEALGLYLIEGGIASAANMLKKNSQFNAHVILSLLTIIAEQDVNSEAAANIVKNIVTDCMLEVEAKGKDSRIITDACAKIVQVTNRILYIPITNGDTRTIISRTPPLETITPKHELEPKLRAEAPAYLHSLLNLKLPEPTGRLYVPILETPERQLRLTLLDHSPMDLFLKTFVEEANGDIPGAEVVERFNEWAEREIGAKPLSVRKVFEMIPTERQSHDHDKKRLLNAAWKPGSLRASPPTTITSGERRTTAV